MLPEWIPLEVWEAYLQMRKGMGKKYQATEYAQKLLIKKLEGMKKEGQDITAIIEQSIMRSYVGLFPVNHDKNIKQQDVTRIDLVDRTRNLIDSYDKPSNKGSTGYEQFRAATQHLKH